MDDRDDRRRDGRSLSWREIDQQREKKSNRDREPKQHSPAALNAQRSYKAALEKAFASGTLGELAKTLQRNPDPSPPVRAPKGPPHASAAAPAPSDDAPTPQPLPAAAPAQKDPDRENRLKLLAKLKEAEGREAISRTVDAYVAKYPKLPDDYDILTKALAHRSDDRVVATLDQLSALIPKEKPRRAKTLTAQLRFLEDTHSDPEIRAYAARVRARL